MGGLGWLFVRGWTSEGSDRRIAITLAPSEQDQILSEKRLLLKAVHGVVTGLSRSDGDVKAVEEAARAAGLTMAADVSPALMAKLPLAFQQMAMSVHQDMDQLADAVVQRESPPQLLRKLEHHGALHHLSRLVSVLGDSIAANGQRLAMRIKVDAKDHKIGGAGTDLNPLSRR